jgi:hypothetical protein
VHGSEGGDCMITSAGGGGSAGLSVQGYPCRSLTAEWVQEHRQSGTWDPEILGSSGDVSCSDNLTRPSRNHGSKPICGVLIGLQAEGLERDPGLPGRSFSLLLVLWWTCIKRLEAST